MKNQLKTFKSLPEFLSMEDVEKIKLSELKAIGHAYHNAFGRILKPKNFKHITIQFKHGESLKYNVLYNNKLIGVIRYEIIGNKIILQTIKKKSNA